MSTTTETGNGTTNNAKVEHNRASGKSAKEFGSKVKSAKEVEQAKAAAKAKAAGERDTFAAEAFVYLEAQAEDISAITKGVDAKVISAALRTLDLPRGVAASVNRQVKADIAGANAKEPSKSLTGLDSRHALDLKEAKERARKNGATSKQIEQAMAYAKASNASRNRTLSLIRGIVPPAKDGGK